MLSPCRVVNSSPGAGKPTRGKAAADGSGAGATRAVKTIQAAAASKMTAVILFQCLERRFIFPMVWGNGRAVKDQLLKVLKIINL
jgi:hypothetical protein